MIKRLAMGCGLFFACTFNICSLPSTSGLFITICLSNLPGLRRALSRISGLFVAAITIMFVFLSKPSISTSN